MPRRTRKDRLNLDNEKNEEKEPKTTGNISLGSAQQEALSLDGQSSVSTQPTSDRPTDDAVRFRTAGQLHQDRLNLNEQREKNMRNRVEDNYRDSSREIAKAQRDQSRQVRQGMETIEEQFYGDRRNLDQAASARGLASSGLREMSQAQLQQQSSQQLSELLRQDQEFRKEVIQVKDDLRREYNRDLSGIEEMAAESYLEAEEKLKTQAITEQELVRDYEERILSLKTMAEEQGWDDEMIRGQIESMMNITGMLSGRMYQDPESGDFMVMNQDGNFEPFTEYNEIKGQIGLKALEEYNYESSLNWKKIAGGVAAGAVAGGASGAITGPGIVVTALVGAVAGGVSTAIVSNDKNSFLKPSGEVTISGTTYDSPEHARESFERRFRNSYPNANEVDVVIGNKGIRFKVGNTEYDTARKAIDALKRR